LSLLHQKILWVLGQGKILVQRGFTMWRGKKFSYSNHRRCREKNKICL
jgi:hypothetical protein